MRGRPDGVAGAVERRAGAVVDLTERGHVVGVPVLRQPAEKVSRNLSHMCL
jgi:hypothetical protein